jgi:conserved hypothetical protein, DprA/Smf-related, family 1
VITLASQPYNIGVIGGSVADNDSYRIARELGGILARRGHIVLCGGLHGIMEGVSEGVKEAGGIVIGILPGYSPDSGNKYLTVGIPTGIGYMRNFLIIRGADVVISIDGATGTLSEAAFALSEGKSVIAIGTPPVTKTKESDGKMISANTPQEAADLAEKEAQERRAVSRKMDSLHGYKS